MKHSFFSGGGRLNRRELLKRISAAGVTAPIAAAAGARTPSPAAENPIVKENLNPGTTEWQLTYVRPRDYRSEPIEGYCSKTSVRPGEAIEIFVSADPVTDVVIDVYRMGYYVGKGGRFMRRLGPYRVEPQPTPPVAEHRLRECRWARTTQFTIPEEWISGVYLGKLSCEAHRNQSYVVFVVRDDRESDLLFQCSDTTWQAYNKWPDEYSLYDSDEPRQPHSARTWISYERPYGKYPQVVDQPLSQGSGEFLLWEYPLSYWLEGLGYDVTYWSNVDTHRDREGLDRVNCFLSVGHDEYWTLNMFNNVKSAVDQGLNAAFLCGNSVKWMVALDSMTGLDKDLVDVRTGLTTHGERIPAEPDPGARPERTMYRLGAFGGLTEAEKARPNYAGPFPQAGPPENTLIGAGNPSPPNGSADWIVTNMDHWLFEGTQMKNGDRIRGLVGWEHHGGVADIPGLEIVAAGTVINSGGGESPYESTIYQTPGGGWVFNAATIFWSIGLSKPPGFTPPHSHHGRPHGEDERVQRITANFFSKCGIQAAG